jgi:protein TonB
MPDFIGGQKALKLYLSTNTIYPEMAVEHNVQGRVIVLFVIGVDGMVDKSSVKILQGIHPACDAEAMRVVKAMPRWTPGRHNGMAVPMIYTVPFVFRVPTTAGKR